MRGPSVAYVVSHNGVSETAKSHLLGFGYWGALCRCSRRDRCLGLLPTLLNCLVDIISNSGPHWFVDYQLVQRCNLLLAIGTDEVVFQQMRLNAFLTVRLLATRSFDGIAEKLIIDGTNQRRISGPSLPDVGLCKSFRSRNLFLPSGAERTVSFARRTRESRVLTSRVGLPRSPPRGLPSRRSTVGQRESRQI